MVDESMDVEQMKLLSTMGIQIQTSLAAAHHHALGGVTVNFYLVS
jgi:hypothetical protein